MGRDIVHVAFQFDDDGPIVDQWLGSNFVKMLSQLGWGFVPTEPEVTRCD